MNIPQARLLALGFTLLLTGFSGPALALPHGPGRQEVTSLCSACHDMRPIELSSGYSQADWRNLIRTMITLPPATEDRITAYLGEHFPPNDRRTPTLIPGPVELDFQTWVVPTLGQRARDPVEAPDGSIWWVGRLDPATGGIELVELDRPRSRPYGIRIDAEGNAWVACNGGPCLYRFDGDTMAATRIDLPNQETHVRRLDIAEDGMIWYVNSGAGRLGRYDPMSGTIREWPSPSGPKSHPYALLVLDGIVWYNESGMRPDVLVRFDPETEAFQSWPIPSSGIYAGILRHMRATRDGDLLIHQSATNHIMRVSISEPSGGQ